MDFQKFKTIVNILIGSLGIWMCQKEKKNKGLPPRVRYVLWVRKPARTVLHFPSLCSSAAHARCYVFPPRLQNFPLSSPFPSCACSPFRPVSNFHIYPISSHIQVPRNCVDNRGIVLERIVLGGISDSAFLKSISSIVPSSLPCLLKTLCNVYSL